MGLFSLARDTLTSYLSHVLDLSQESSGTGEGLDPSEPFTTERRDVLALAPYTFAIKRFRRIGRLWIAAGGIGEKDSDTAYSPAQVVFPAWRPEGDPDHLTFTQWQFDVRLSTSGLRSLFDEINDSCIETGRAIVEVEWVREGQTGDYPGHIVANDFHVHDPHFFVINPSDLPLGLYLKPYVDAYSVSKSDRLPDGRFLLFSSHPRYSNPYGTSEFQIIDTIHKYLVTILGFHARGLERSGVGSIIAKYGSKLLGKGHETERQQFRDEMAKLKSNTVTVTHIDNEILTLPTDIDSAAFDKFEKLCISTISLVGTGSPTTFIENQHGTYAQAEATDVGEKSDLEQNDATLISEAFTYQFITRLLDYNFPDVPSYPVMQIIEPVLIQPTINQDTKDLIAVQQEQEQDDDPEPDEPTESDEPQKTVPPVAEQQLSQFAETDPDDDGEEREGAPRQAFPMSIPAPPLFDDVTEAAQISLQAMPVLAPRDFRELTDDDKHQTFTIAATRGLARPEPLLNALKNAIVDTLGDTNEATAWAAYTAAAKEISKEHGFMLSDRDLIPSFRFARSKAYTAGIDEYIEQHEAGLYALQFVTQDDFRVRWEHEGLHGLTRPVNDPIWEQITLPLGFGCRCYKLPVSIADYEADPAAYALTADRNMPEHIPAPFEDGYQIDDDETEDEDT